MTESPKPKPPNNPPHPPAAFFAGTKMWERYRGLIAASEWVGSYEIEDPEGKQYASITISAAFNRAKSLSNALKMFPEAPDDMLIAYDMLTKGLARMERKIARLYREKIATLKTVTVRSK